MDLKKELSSNQTILLLMPSIEYNEDIIDVVKQIADKNVLYITLNKTFHSLQETFKKNNIDIKNIVFLDAISKTITNEPPQTKSCYYISSPEHLTELSIIIDKFIKHGYDYLIFDSLTNLLIYSKKAPVAAFVSRTINKIKASKTKAVFYALSVKEQEELINETSMFVDKVVDMGKN